MYEIYFNPNIGLVYIREEEGFLTEVKFISKEEKNQLENYNANKGQISNKDTEVLKEAIKQLDEYFNGTRKSFDLPLRPKGTLFMQSVYKALLKIPYGRTASYKDIAMAIGNEKACRAVGNANNKNPIAIIIPCHRVIGQNGKLVGYAGGLEIKQALLSLENSNNNDRQDNNN
jgi:methylated-DNA-[protein]-cysteine S-methyltransferase